MLARLEAIPGVREARAESSGRYFLVELGAAASGETAARVVEALGRAARVLPPDEAEPQHAARRRGEAWVTAREARTLSFVESRIVSVRASDAAATDARLGREERARLAEAIREEMFDHVERLLAGVGEPGRFFDDWPALAARAAARCTGWLGAGRLADVRASLVAYFAPGGRGR